MGKTKRLTKAGSKTEYTDSQGGTFSTFKNMLSGSKTAQSAKGAASQQTRSEAEVLSSMDGASVSEIVEALKQNKKKNDDIVKAKLKAAAAMVSSTTHTVGQMFSSLTATTKSLGAVATDKAVDFESDDFVKYSLDDQTEPSSGTAYEAEEVATPAAPEAPKAPAAKNTVSQDTIAESIRALESGIQKPVDTFSFER